MSSQTSTMGVDPSRAYATNEFGRPFEASHRGVHYRFAEATQDIKAHSLVVVSPEGRATAASADEVKYGDDLAVCPIDLSAGQFAFMATAGVATVRAEKKAQASTPLFIGDEPGVISPSGIPVDGLVLIKATSEELAVARLRLPAVDAE